MIGLGLGLNFGGRSAPAPFVPTNVNGCLLWLRADASNVTLVSGKVSAWNDSSGSGDSNRNAVQATALARPTYNASDAHFAGNPTMSFTAAQALVTGTWSTAIAQPCTVFAVAREDTAGKYLYDGLTQSTFILYDDGTPVVRLASPSNSNSAPSPVNTTVAFIAVYSSALTSSRIYFNSNTPNTPNNCGANGAAGLTVGNWGGLALGGWTLAEIAVWNRDLTSPEIAELNAYAKRYGSGVGA